jgi:hypothetical protein
MATVHKITVNRGTTYSITVSYLVDGVATSIVGSTVLFTVKSTEYDDDDTDGSALIQKTVTSHTDPTHGISTITLTPADTRDVVPGNYYYSIKIDLASNDVTVYELDEGRFILDGDPTNRAI